MPDAKKPSPGITTTEHAASVAGISAGLYQSFTDPEMAVRVTGLICAAAVVCVYTLSRALSKRTNPSGGA